MAFDVYGITNQLEKGILDAIVTRLEARGNHPFFVKMMQDYFDAMGLDSAKHVLDLGCGTGVASRAIARRDSFSGKILGIDLSPYLIEIARQLSKEREAIWSFELVTVDN